MTSLGPVALAEALALVVVQVLCQGSRFLAVLPHDAGLGRLVPLQAFSVGEVVNALVPARVGDAVKVVMLRQVRPNTHLGVSRVTGALLADKVVAIATLLVLSAVAAAVVSHGRLSAAGIGRDLRWVGLVAVVAVGLALATRRLAARADAMGRFGAARRFARGVHRGLSALREPRCVLYGATFGIAGWLAEVCVIHILCSSLGISLGTAAIVLAVAALNLGIAIPLSMANLGAYEAALTFGLTRWGVPIAPAIAVALAHHAIEITGIACTAGLTSIARSWAPRRRRRAGRSRDE